MATAASKRPRRKGKCSPCATRNVMRERSGCSRASRRAAFTVARLGSTPTTWPRPPTWERRSRTTTPVPQPTSSAASPRAMGMKRRNRRRRRCWDGVRPRRSRASMNRSGLAWASMSRKGSGWELTARAGHGWPETMASVSARGEIAARALRTAEVVKAVRIRALHRPRARHVGVADGILHQLVVADGRRAGGRHAAPHPEVDQPEGGENPDQDQGPPHGSSAVWLDRDRPEKLAIMSGQLERWVGSAAPSAREEDPRLRAPPKDLLDGVAGGVGGRQGDLDGVEQLPDEGVDGAVAGHSCAYDTGARRRMSTHVALVSARLLLARGCCRRAAVVGARLGELDAV